MLCKVVSLIYQEDEAYSMDCRLACHHDGVQRRQTAAHCNNTIELQDSYKVRLAGLDILCNLPLPTQTYYSTVRFHVLLKVVRRRWPQQNPILSSKFPLSDLNELRGISTEWA